MYKRKDSLHIKVKYWVSLYLDSYDLWEKNHTHIYSMKMNIKMK